MSGHYGRWGYEVDSLPRSKSRFPISAQKHAFFADISRLYRIVQKTVRRTQSQSVYCVTANYEYRAIQISKIQIKMKHSKSL